MISRSIRSMVAITIFLCACSAVIASELTPAEKAEILADQLAQSQANKTNTRQVFYYFSDFEANDGGWANATGSYGEWEWGPVVTGLYVGCDSSPEDEPSGAYSGSNVWGTDLDGCYDNSGASSILEQTFDFSSIAAPIYLSWYNWYEVFYSFDTAEVYINGTLIWEVTTDIPTATYIPEVIDISAYAGNPTVTIQFDLYATSVVNRMGWYLDDIGISDFDPLVVDLLYFNAKQIGNDVRLEWATASEIQTFGFDIFRGEIQEDGSCGRLTKINGRLIPARGSAFSGATYSFNNLNVEMNKSYRYFLKEITVDNESNEIASADIHIVPKPQALNLK